MGCFTLTSNLHLINFHFHNFKCGFKTCKYYLLFSLIVCMYVCIYIYIFLLHHIYDLI